MQNVYYSPSQIIDWSDPGDETLRNYRYQIGYGVVLLVKSIVNNDYINIWCEHHDDFLCETEKGLFHAVQVKTRKPEIGEWRINDEPILKSIYRFYELELKFPGYIDDLFIVSNASYMNVDSKNFSDVAKCPMKFCQMVGDNSLEKGLEKEINKMFDKIKQYISEKSSSINETKLINVIKKIKWANGPSRDGFHEYIVQSYMTQVPGISSWKNQQIVKALDELILKIFKASSLFIGSPDMWSIQNSIQLSSSFNSHKRISVEEIKSFLQQYKNEQDDLKAYYASHEKVRLDALDKTLEKVDKKMKHGGIADKHVLKVKNFSLAAESRLLELMQLPDIDESVLENIEAIVENVCDECELKAKLDSKTLQYGDLMLSLVYEKMRSIVYHTPQDVYNQRYEFLLGIAGLMTQECRVWWSPKFDLQ